MSLIRTGSAFNAFRGVEEAATVSPGKAVARKLHLTSRLQGSRFAKAERNYVRKQCLEVCFADPAICVERSAKEHFIGQWRNPLS